MPDGSHLPIQQDRLTDIRLIACRSPVRFERVVLALPAGLTLAEMIDLAGVDPVLRRFAQVWLVDAAMTAEPWWVPAEHWHRVRPKPGTVLTLRVVPGKGGGGKGILGIVLGIVTAAAGFFLGPIVGVALGIGPALGSALVGIVGKLLTFALVPPPKPPSAPSLGGRGVAASPTYAITGARNQANPYGPVPRLYGKHKLVPPYGAQPYTEIVGDDQYLRLLFCLGYGPLEIADIRIGETPIEAFDDVEMEVRQGFEDDDPVTLYPADVFEEPLSVELTQAGGPAVRVSQPDADELSIDMTFDRGLGLLNSQGTATSSRTVQFTVEYRAAGSADPWISAGTFSCTGSTRSLARRGFRWVLPARGQYEVRLTRTTEDAGSSVFKLDHSVWTSLRSIRNEHPLRMTELALIALRIRASDQLNGVIDQLSCVATAMLPIWNGASWSAPTATRNPAWAYLDALKGSANKRPVASDAQIDLPAFLAWAADCDAPAQDGAATYTFDGVFDFEGTLFDALKSIAAAGRASFAMIDGRFSIVQDKPQVVPVQHFTPRNSRGFRATKPFLDVPHALKVQFVNEAAGWRKDERIVYADGFDENNATKFETLDTFGITRAEQAWREGRYHQAVAKLRPEIYELSTDIEHIVCRAGDLVRVSHDVPLWGSGWGRVKARTLAGGDVTALTLDERVTMEAGKNYGLRVRRDDGTSQLLSLLTVPGESAMLTLATPIAAEDAPAIGDLAMFGEAGLESIEAKVLRIEPEQDFGARLYLVDAALAIHDADTGPIPPFVSGISLPAPLAQRRPPAPIVEDVRSDESALVLQPDGAWLTRIAVTLGALSGGDVPAAAIEVQFRPTGTNGAWRRLVTAVAPEVSVIPVDDGATYDLRLRSVSVAGTTSDWVPIEAHRVVGKTTPPPDIVDFRREGDTARWQYPDLPRDLAGFVVRHRYGDVSGLANPWADSVPLHGGLLTGTEVSLAPLVGLGTQTLMAKAVDVAGNESLEPALLVIELGNPLLANVILTRDWSGLGFPGAIVNGSIEPGTADLIAEDVGTLFWAGSPGAPVWTADPGGAFWTADYREMTFTATLVPTEEEVPSRLTLAADVTGGVWEILYRVPQPMPFWTGDSNAFWTGDANPMWSEATGTFVPWPGEIDDLARQPYEIRVRTGAGPVQGRISTLRAILDVPDERETIEDLIIGGAGTRAPLSKTYRSIRAVHLTLQEDGGNAVTAKSLDKSATLGPLIACFDAALAQTGGLVDVTIEGVRG